MKIPPYFTTRASQRPLSKWLWIFLFLALGTPILGVPATVKCVVDGDTIKVVYQGKTESVRLLYIDTPECRENAKLHRDVARNHSTISDEMRKGRAAANYTQSRVHEGDHVDLQFDVEKRDKYHRLLACVYLPTGECLNKTLLQLGYAKRMIIAPNTNFTQALK